MRFSSTIAAAALVASTAAADNYLGFNSGATKADRSAKFKEDWVAEFKTAQGLKNAPGKFNAVRLYTNIQAYAQDDPIEAFEAAIETETYMLLGIWASGTTNIDKELSALNKAIKKYGSKFTDLVIGMSVGSEDLYRNSVTGVTNEAGVGQDPDVLVKFIEQYRKAVADTPLSSVPVGHVDTWDVWGNTTNKVVVDAIDFLGVDEYPYYETGKGNAISNSGQLFDRAYDATIGVAGGKPVWVTETGWPSSGPAWDEAEASVKNAKYYWNEVGCRRLFGKTPTFWYTLRDSNPDNKMQFAITKDLSTTPLFDLTCPTTFETPEASENTASSSGSATKSGSSGSASETGSASAGNSNGEDSTAVQPDGPGSAASGLVASMTATAALAVVGAFFTLL
ncbi:related to glucan 1,3-beta-glucosidase [Cephalotrichum gorgonifer]|uniref:Related to glucan 1,3-beta-glucosidase n=1 Tax=Cephalotrichum gorgonifer TaxID=2041049 RepID=A0AAE8SVX0_9PEZI|nr:related to glucan 1,3-beta-glucosidase [Cephalotrichum gorgonifer]